MATYQKLRGEVVLLQAEVDKRLMNNPLVANGVTLKQRARDVSTALTKLRSVIDDITEEQSKRHG